ncbi:hypothetical protein KR018_007520 [Drosophila ironensis]|nr:hypothetical protein KR018_007520 [Drosophila ironensis]
MDFGPDLNSIDEDSIVPCRACGIYYLMPETAKDLEAIAMVEPIFGDDASAFMVDIIEQMSSWNLKVRMPATLPVPSTTLSPQVVEEDGRPQHLCISCLDMFKKVFAFKRSCLETQEQFDGLEVRRSVVVKREIDPEPEQKFCGFIYIDTDDEEISDEDGSRRVSAAFDIPHVPIKEEHMARVPVQQETAKAFQPPEPVQVGAPSVQPQVDDMTAIEGLLGNPFESSSGSAFAGGRWEEEDDEDGEEEEEEEEVLRFTYDDDGETAAAVPPPMQTPSVYCKLCQHESPDQEEHLNHMRRTHLLKDWECHICGKKFTNAKDSRIKLHLKFHKLSKHLKCSICGFLCNSKDTLKEHKQAVHSRTKCSYCRKSVKNSLLQAHMNKHLEEREAELAQRMQPHLLKARAKCSENGQHIRVAPSKETIQSGSSKVEAIANGESRAAKEPALRAATHIKMDSPEPAKPFFPQPPSTPWQAASSQRTLPGSTISQAENFTCTLCCGIFPDAHQLQAHMELHQTPVKRSPKGQRQAKPQDTSPPLLGKQTDGEPHERSRTNESLNVSDREKTYNSCHICGKQFDLMIKLNRHLKQHKKAPF